MKKSTKTGEKTLTLLKNLCTENEKKSCSF